MIGRDAQVRELPGGGVVADRGSERHCGPAIGCDVERDLGERQRDPGAARLQIRLLQRPVLEKRAPAVLIVQSLERGGFGSREEAPRELLEVRAASQVFDVEAEIVGERHSTGGEARRVRQVEAERGCAGGSGDFGPAVLGLAEAPRLGRDVCVSRERHARERPRHEPIVTVRVRRGPSDAREIVCRQPRPAPLDRLGVSDEFQFGVPDFNDSRFQFPNPQILKSSDSPILQFSNSQILTFAAGSAKDIATARPEQARVAGAGRLHSARG